MVASPCCMAAWASLHMEESQEPRGILPIAESSTGLGAHPIPERRNGGGETKSSKLTPLQPSPSACVSDAKSRLRQAAGVERRKISNRCAGSGSVLRRRRVPHPGGPLADGRGSQRRLLAKVVTVLDQRRGTLAGSGRDGADTVTIDPPSWSHKGDTLRTQRTAAFCFKFRTLYL